MRAPHLLAAVLLAVGLTALPEAPPTGRTSGDALAPVAARGPQCDGRPATIVGTRRADRIEGTRGNDVIVGGGGADRIDGGRGNDVICGNGGADVLQGGRGHDVLRGGRDLRALGPGASYLVGDLLIGGPGRDHLVGGADPRTVDQRRRPDTYSWADARRRVVVDLAGPGVGTARGRGRDTVVVGPSSGLVGSRFGDRITGSTGHDHVRAGDGNDRIDTGPGNDRVYADRSRKRAGRDLVVTGSGNDLVSSLAGRDEIATGPGADFVEAFSASPTKVRVGGGADYVGQYVARGRGAVSDGGSGNDVIAYYGRLLAGATPARRFVVDYRNGTARSADGAARGTVRAFEGHRFVGPLRWAFFGGRGPDRVWAIEGGPLLARGYAGNDSFTGSNRDDRLFGGGGTDYADGSAGRDRCRGIERGGC